MAHIYDGVLDGGLDYLSASGDRIDICSQEPVTYAEAITTYSLGNETTITINAASERGAGGRECIVDAITSGTVDGTASATHFSIVDVSATELLATGSISVPQDVTSGNTFTLTSFTVGIPDPA
jgi:hypothetical protein